MPNSTSAKKRVRQNEAHKARNRWRKRRVKDQTDTFLKALVAHDVPSAEEEFRKTCRILDRIADTGTIHKNTAARRKSRLSRRLKDMKAKAS